MPSTGENGENGEEAVAATDDEDGEETGVLGQRDLFKVIQTPVKIWNFILEVVLILVC